MIVEIEQYVYVDRRALLERTVRVAGPYKPSFTKVLKQKQEQTVSCLLPMFIILL